MNAKELIEKSRKIANKGIQVNDGYDYLVPAADLVKKNRAIHLLADELEKRSRTEKMND